MEFIKGMDISTLFEEEVRGAEYFDKGIKEDALLILKRYGTNYVRLRIWNDPYGEDGEPYSAGSNDLFKTIILSKRAKALGMGILLDFHYSDFWADPGKQIVPKAWRGLSKEELAVAVYDYTVEVLNKLKEENVLPDMVQVGNEITNGLLWPVGKKPAFDEIALFINAGIRGVRAVSKDIPIMLHLDNGGFNSMYVEWFDNFIKRGEEFEIIGLSYYPFWHGTLEELSLNMKDMAERYGKKIVVAEVSMGFSMEDYRIYEISEQALKNMWAEIYTYPSDIDQNYSSDIYQGYSLDNELNRHKAYERIPSREEIINHYKAIKCSKEKSVLETQFMDKVDNYISDNYIGMATRQELVEKLHYPMTPEGQADFMQDIMQRIAEVDGGLGFFYWEPAWIPVYGCGWASEAALEYTGEKGPGGNEWANQALFDYEGKVLPALQTIKNFDGKVSKNLLRI